MDRRRFLRSVAALPGLLAYGSPGDRWREPQSTWHRESSVLAALRGGQPLPRGITEALDDDLDPPPPLGERFSDLDRRFVFEYYPWYGRDPWRHWDQWGRRPPDDLAAAHVPDLGAYDSRSHDVIERHARWILDSGVRSIALSWWGRGSYEDALVHRILDVMKSFGISVTFGLEPYRDDRGHLLAEDVLYLLTEYGEKRGWDAFLVLRNEDGGESPVFKVFRSILPEVVTDCHGKVSRVPDHTPDGVWRRQTERLRRELRWDFDRVFLLADSLDFGRTPASGFDGIGIYDNFIGPERYHPLARGASAAGLLFSFNVNPGYDEIVVRDVPEGSCYVPRSFVPPAGGDLDFSRFDHRELAAELAAERIRESFAATLDAQTDPALSNTRLGFFLVYVNSFNEWHEGHAFEPMKDDVELTPAQHAVGYHNASFGRYRLATLAESVRPLVGAARFERGFRASSSPRASRTAV